MPTSFHVTVGSFEGPFDLLLQLCARQKVDIYEVSLAQITDDYLAVLKDMDQVDLEVATEFLVVAATLLELKAARLLPGEDDPEMEELALEARYLLYARLLDYRIFKEAAAFLAEQFEQGSGFYPRAVALESRYAGIVPEVEMRISAEDLASLAARAFAERPEPVVDVSHLQPVRLTVREAAGMVALELNRAGGRLRFRELVAGCRHRIEVIVYFLAVLELYKHEHVELEQATCFGELVVDWNPEHAWANSVLAAMDVDEPAVEGQPASPVPQDLPDVSGVPSE